MRAGVVLTGSCSGNKNTKNEERTVNVKIMEANNGNQLMHTGYIGVAEEESGADSSFQVSGKINGIDVNEGQKVKKGQKLASIDTEDLRSSNSAAEASYHQAQDAFERMKKLYDNCSLPEIKFIEVKSKLEQAQSAYAITKKNLNESVVYAPFDGIISKSMITAGENIMPGKTAFRLINTDGLKIRFSVPEKEIGNILTGDKVNISVPALKNSSYAGHIVEKGVTTSAINPLYVVKLIIDYNHGRILPGMTCRVYPENETNSTDIVFPTRAVMTNNSGEKFVWTENNGRANAVYVETVEFSQGGVISINGLNPGAKIVTEEY